MSSGGSVKSRQEAKEFNKAQIVDILRRNSGKPMAAKVIMEELNNRGCNIKLCTVQKYSSELSEEYSEITLKKGIGYIWGKEESEFYERKASNDTENKSAYRKKNPVMRNGEGYFDPTSGAAIRNIEGDDPYSRLGEVWSVKGSNGMIEWFMILSDWGAVKIGLPLYAGDYRSRIRVKVDVGGATLYGDATNLRSKPSKYFDTYIGNVEDKTAKCILDDVLMAICDPDISPIVVKSIMPANTITIDGTLYTEADVKSKIDTIDILREQIDKYYDDIDELNKDIESKNVVIRDKEIRISSLEDALRKSKSETKPMVIQVDGEIYNEEEIAAIIRARNTVRVGDKIYRASDICELLDNESESTDISKDEIKKLVTMNNIYKQFFDAYCQGMAKGVVE